MPEFNSFCIVKNAFQLCLSACCLYYMGKMFFKVMGLNGPLIVIQINKEDKNDKKNTKK